VEREMSIFQFATCSRDRAALFLNDERFAWINEAAKAFVLDHLAVDLADGFRVLDPDYHNALVETRNAELVKQFQQLQSDVEVKLHD
jgi:hypothetical protein